jgi:uncharacterized membrane protein
MTDATKAADRRGVWSYGLAMLASLVGLADAMYLTIEHLGGRSVKCTVTAGCSQVLSSSYAVIGGIPTAAFGAGAYFTAFSLATLAAFGYRRARPAFAALAAAMLAMSIWLVYLQAFVLRAFCQYCLLSASMTAILAGIAVFNFRRAVRE